MEYGIYQAVKDFVIRELTSKRQISPEMVEAIARLIEAVK